VYIFIQNIYFIQGFNVKNMSSDPLIAGMVNGFANSSAALCAGVIMKFLPELSAFRSVASLSVISMSFYVFVSMRDSAAPSSLLYTIILFGSLGATGMCNTFLLVVEMRVPPQNFSAVFVLL